ncbi:hypothetical protein [Sulfurimonas sp.]
MKILVRLFLIILVMFSYSYGNEEYFKSLYGKQVALYKKNVENTTRWANSSRARQKQLLNKRIKEAEKKREANYEYHRKSNQNALNTLQASYKKSKKDTYIKLYNAKKLALETSAKKYQKDVDSTKSAMKRITKSSRMYSWIKTSLSRKIAYVKNNEKESQELEKAYATYKKQIKKSTTPPKVNNNINANTLKISSQNTGKSTINASNVNTNVTINNANIVDKAKASVGSVSIGKDEK